ncbi:surface carbohydrate biosynthesis protein [Pseudodesulfovibrio karagichevae]|uniref:Surface carbohydrate biosynthesis protein n=1 Tax=Pseudodesulfovibrio karagichevae TaxID=3239305 RepID=A0ABV4JYZ2_9BACT
MLCAIPLEIAVRELNGMLYQSLHLAAKGMPTLIGERMVNEYVVGCGKPVLYFDSDQSVGINETILRDGGVVFNVNPEGMHVAQEQQTLDNFTRIAHCVSLICTWGERQVRDLRSVFPEEVHDRIRATGYPPFDLIQPRFKPLHENPAIIEEHGRDYVLINTSFAYANNIMGFERYMKMLSRMDEWKIYADPEYLAIQQGIHDHQKLMLDAVVDLAAKLSGFFPERHVIIRPHPGEDASFYSDRLAGLKNVFVEKKGTAREWIASAGFVIHHDCTTGMEALLMGCPVIQYRPHYNKRAMAPIMPSLGVKTTNPDEVADVIRSGSMPEETRQAQLEILAPYLANSVDSAAQTIAGLAAEYGKDRETWLPAPLGAWESAKCWRKYVSKLLRARQPGKNGRKVRYALNKFPRISLEEISRLLERLRRCEPGLPEVAVKQLCLNTFLITPRD